MRGGLAGLIRDSRGASAIEYGLLLGLLALAALAALSGVADGSIATWRTVAEASSAATSQTPP